MSAYTLERSAANFAAAREKFEGVVAWLDGDEARELTHAELETRLDEEERELLRQLLQDHLSLRAEREEPLDDVVGADGIARRDLESGHTRGCARYLATLR